MAHCLLFTNSLLKKDIAPDLLLYKKFSLIKYHKNSTLLQYNKILKYNSCSDAKYSVGNFNYKNIKESVYEQK